MIYDKMYSFQGAPIEKSLLQCEFSAALVFFGISVESSPRCRGNHETVLHKCVLPLTSKCLRYWTRILTCDVPNLSMLSFLSSPFKVCVQLLFCFWIYF